MMVEKNADNFAEEKRRARSSKRAHSRNRAFFWGGVCLLNLLCIFYALWNPGNKNVNQYQPLEGITYSGRVHHARFSGTGQIIFSDGTQYTGEFLNGLINGSGTFRRADGLSANGNFDEDGIQESTKIETPEKNTWRMNAQGTWEQSVEEKHD